MWYYYHLLIECLWLIITVLIFDKLRVASRIFLSFTMLFRNNATRSWLEGAHRTQGPSLVHRSLYLFSELINCCCSQLYDCDLAPPPPNIVVYKTQPQLRENTQIYNLSLKSPTPNIWVRTQTRNLSTYSNYFRYLCTYLKFVLKHLFDHLCIHLYFGVDFIMNLFIF